MNADHIDPEGGTWEPAAPPMTGEQGLALAMIELAVMDATGESEDVSEHERGVAIAWLLCDEPWDEWITGLGPEMCIQALGCDPDEYRERALARVAAAEWARYLRTYAEEQAAARQREWIARKSRGGRPRKGARCGAGSMALGLA